MFGNKTLNLTKTDNEICGHYDKQNNITLYIVYNNKLFTLMVTKDFAKEIKDVIDLLSNIYGL